MAIFHCGDIFVVQTVITKQLHGMAFAGAPVTASAVFPRLLLAYSAGSNATRVHFGAIAITNRITLRAVYGS